MAERTAALAGRTQPRTLSQLVDQARHHHGVLCADHRATGRLWQLFPADSNRRGGHGLPGPEHALVLGHVSWLHRDAVSLLCGGRRASARLDWVSAAECAAIRWAG